MKSLFTLFAAFTCLFASAQTYQPFPTGDASWKVGRCWYFYPGGWHDEITFNMDGSDTLINSVSYKKVIMKHRHAPGTAFDSSYVRILGGMRESNKKVFFVSDDLCGDSLERMVYDFNYEHVGDTIYTNVMLFGFTDKVPHVISAIDSVLIGSSYHRRLSLSDTSGAGPWETWTEGVGSNWGLGYATYWIITDNSYDLVCFNTNGTLKYQNPAPTYAYCQAPFPVIDCDSGVVVPNPGCTADFESTKHTDTIAFKGNTNLVTVNGWEWDFGDGQTSTDQNPEYHYTLPGWYEACLTVTGLDSTGANCTASKCDSLYISDGCIDSSLICPTGSLCCDAPLVDSVCGCNGVTYTNGCIAALWNGVLHYTSGPCIATINVENAPFKRVRLVPNPAGERVTLTVDGKEPGELFVYVRNILGEILLTHQENVSGKSSSTIELNLEKIPPGIYMVELRLNEKMEVKKLVKE